MMSSRILAFAALAAGSFMSAQAGAEPLEGKFRGGYVCENATPTKRDVLRVPLDLVINGSSVQFARPLFNLNGTRVVGNELGAGTIDGDGRLHLTSEWSYLGATAHGDYSGTLTATGGTLTGTQVWNRPGAESVRRTCTAALVPASSSGAASRQQ